MWQHNISIRPVAEIYLDIPMMHFIDSSAGITWFCCTYTKITSSCVECIATLLLWDILTSEFMVISRGGHWWVFGELHLWQDWCLTDTKFSHYESIYQNNVIIVPMLLDPVLFYSPTFLLQRKKHSVTKWHLLIRHVDVTSLHGDIGILWLLSPVDSLYKVSEIHGIHVVSVWSLIKPQKSRSAGEKRCLQAHVSSL